MVILDAPDAELRELLRSCLAVPRWIEQIANAAPFTSAQAWLECARHAADPLEPAEIDQALADHPRIGAGPRGAGRSAAFSRAEQQAPDADDPDLAAAIAAGNAAYEARFGRVFLIRAAGRTRAEIRAEQQRRLALDDETEIENVGRELREIAGLRLRRLIDEGTAPSAANPPRSRVTTHVLDIARGTPAVGMGVTLERGTPEVSYGWEPIGRGRTDTDGRIAALGPPALPVGRYRVRFETEAYFAVQQTAAFYPEVAVVIGLSDPDAHYHVPLLLSPFGYSTYRGS
jgi:hydroxyisourate hydrolase